MVIGSLCVACLSDHEILEPNALALHFFPTPLSALHSQVFVEFPKAADCLEDIQTNILQFFSTVHLNVDLTSQDEKSV